jgi:hypothetical protein
VFRGNSSRVPPRARFQFFGQAGLSAASGQTPSVENIQHFGCVLPKGDATNSCSKNYCNLFPAGGDAFPCSSRPPQSSARQTCASVRAAPLFAGAQGSPSCRIESADGKLPPRQRAPFVAVHGQQLFSLLRDDCCELLWSFRGSRSQTSPGIQRHLRRILSSRRPRIAICFRAFARLA